MKGVLATIVSGHISFGTASINLALEEKKQRLLIYAARMRIR